jgi:GNAT superfamily N-acetyltransferase
MDSKSIVRKGMRVRLPPRALTIRTATIDDARALAEVHVASWLAAYRGLVHDDVLDRLSVDARADQWDEWLRAGETRTLVAGDVDGFVTFREINGEVRALYVAPDRVRRGIGNAWIDAAHTALLAAGRDEASLWVLEGNAPAFAFYAAHGYVPDGARMVHEPTGAHEVRLYRPLAPRG